jgi:hypothetical protein
MNSLRILLFSLLLTAAALSPAQGFLVRPMIAEFQAAPGATVTFELEIQNTALDTARTVEVHLVQLGQGPDGSFVALGNEGTEQPRSSLAWLTPSTREIPLAAGSSGKVAVTVRVPREARGTYFAGFIFQTKPEGGGNVPLVIRFLIPVLIDVQGPAQKTIKVEDVGLALMPRQGERSAQTFGAVALKNDGTMWGRATGEIVVSSQVAGNWRRVTSIKLPNRRVLPGSQIFLGDSTGRNLPTGTYRLDARINVDGRQLPTVTKEIRYEGDPAASVVAEDVELALDPATQEVDLQPRATRNVTVNLRNPSQSTVKAKASALIPPTLSGVAVGSVVGESFSMHEWMSVSPAEVTLGPGQERRVRVQVSVPAEELQKPFYFGAVKFDLEYPDGQSAGSLQTFVVGRNKRLEGAPALNEQAPGTVSQVEGSKYQATWSVANVGDTPLNLKAAATISDVGGTQQFGTIPLELPSAPMLPLGTIRIGGEFDLKELKPGAYILRLALPVGSDTRIFVIPIQVTDSPQGRRAEVVRSGGK